MLKEDLSLRRLMKPQQSQVDCQMIVDVGQPYARPCNRLATHVVVVDAGCWRAVCADHGARQRNLDKPGKSFEIEYDLPEPTPCLHLNTYAFEWAEHAPFAEPNGWRCDDCGAEF